MACGLLWRAPCLPRKEVFAMCCISHSGSAQFVHVGQDLVDSLVNGVVNVGQNQ